MTQYLSIKLRQMPSGDWVRLNCLAATADFYGWSAALLSSAELREKAKAPNERLVADPHRTKPWRGGSGVRICRHPSTDGFPAGQTNRFRLTWGFSNKDLALLARITSVEWHWMETRGHRRVRRSEWLTYPIHPAHLKQHPLLLAHPAIEASPRQAEGLAVPAVADSFRAEPCRSVHG